ncbi:MAG: ABC transporter ATP-binding protein [Dongiaceae bacterium]
MAEIRLQQVTKRFGQRPALADLTLTVADGEFFVLLGPTGAGKTTTLRLIAGLERPSAGTILIDGQDVGPLSPAERDVALVFQYYSLYPRYSVRQNLEFPLRSRARRLGEREIAARVAAAAATLRIDHLLDRRTDRLSGGEMQRVSIGRAIVREPRAFLMDEPLSNLDAKLRELLRAELKDLQTKLRATFLFVTHDQIEAMSMGDKVGVLDGGQMVQIGTPWEIYNNPRNLFVAGFVGSPGINLLSGEIRDGLIAMDSAGFAVPVRGPRLERLAGRGGAVTLGIRPEDVRIDPAGDAEARVFAVEDHGVERIVALRARESLIRATVPATAPRLAIDDPVRFGWNEAKLHLFDTATGETLLQ